MFQFSARESAGQTKSWSEMADEEAEARTPGHAVHMHEKLSSPSRKRYSRKTNLVLNVYLRLSKILQ